MFKQFFQIPVAIFAALMLTLTACEKDKDKPKPEPTVQEKMVGKWDVKSFTIDGVEIKGSIVTTSNFDLKAYTGNDGDFAWVINYADGTSDHTNGDYTVDTDDKEIKFDADNGEHIQFDFDLDGNDLELSGTLEGERYILKAKRD